MDVGGRRGRMYIGYLATCAGPGKASPGVDLLLGAFSFLCQHPL